MTRRPATGELATLLALLDEAYDRRAWHGPTLRGALRGVSAAQAARRPGPGRHNVWELAVHCAYWKYAVRRRLTGERRGRFLLAGSNWFPRPVEVSERAWKRDLELLATEHRLLRETIAGLRPGALDGSVAGRRRARMIRGIAAHDLYHAGQVSLTKRVVR
ncbi:MAG TPA: DinB family protein [Gemmatimonadales bacterium]|nr:DinB family protein [Gemmatimonadales bacterium]